ncbi:glycosyltransferase family 4 protein [Myroides odoratimimus]|uniref:glycosyltransferase family 4 protein n=1 Tax=Myroides odoratimimus TaxID=76832 RepID=UPI002574B952|nr:glycosyltransferase family 4 protein [Myroides odoratimimus]MDM1514304.1 glycosyltransferase family 4 protein [Myroides odoratimimus]MEC4043997.1 glycosyltransferase family 4 protein [Myroides odoratimimus]MEC4151827.1 glycosyltransferase family 4 protein [Myroides odoratimimus]
MKSKIIRTSTVPQSLNTLLKGQLKYLNSYYDVIGLSSKGEQLLEVNKREGVKTIDVNMERRIAPFKDIISLIKLIVVFRKERPLIVHSITPKAGLLTMLAGKIAGVPIRLHTFTGLIFPTRTGLMQKLLIKMDQLLCWSATDIFPEGNGVKNDLIRFNITKKPLEVIANGNVNGIDLSYFCPDAIKLTKLQELKQELNIKEKEFVFIFVGRLVRDKGINELINAFERLQQKVNRSIKLILVGPLETELDPLEATTLKNINENEDIISVGYQKDVRSYLGISDALVFPSYREGFPNVVIQAGAMNLPSIVSDINGCNEIIIEGINGSIIPVKDISILVERMYQLIYDKEYYNSLKQNSRKLILERYEQSVVWDAVLEKYSSAIEKYKHRKEKNV